MLRTAALCAVIGSCAAYVPPMMSLSANRREVVAGAATAAVAAPLLRASPAAAEDKLLRAPYIYIFDSRGCKEHRNTEYTGPKSNDEDDQCCVKVESKTVKVSESAGGAFIQQALGQFK